MKVFRLIAAMALVMSSASPSTAQSEAEDEKLGEELFHSGPSRVEPFKSVIEYQEEKKPITTTAFAILSSDPEVPMPRTKGRIKILERRDCSNGLAQLPTGYRTVGFETERRMFGELKGDLYEVVSYSSGPRFELATLDHRTTSIFNHDIAGGWGNQRSHCIPVEQCIEASNLTTLGCYSDMRGPGCYVNSEWMLWLEHRAKGELKRKYDDLGPEKQLMVQCSSLQLKSALEEVSKIKEKSAN